MVHLSLMITGRKGCYSDAKITNPLCPARAPVRGTESLSIQVAQHHVQSPLPALELYSTQASLYRTATKWRRTIRSRFSRASAVGAGPGFFANSEALNASILIHVGPAFSGRALLGSTCSSRTAVLSKTLGWMNLPSPCL